MMTRYLGSSFGVTLIGALLALAGCSGGSSPSPDRATVSLAVSDAPVQEALLVCVEFTDVEFKGAGSENPVFTFEPPKQINLLDYQGINAAPLLVNEVLEPGEYQWIRMGVNAELGAGGGAGAGPQDTECVGAGSYIVMSDGGVYGLYIPSGGESGLKFNRGFTLPVNGSADLVAEWDLMKTIHAPPGLSPDYIMRPTVRLMDRTSTGSIGGEVSMALATQPGCMAAVYIFEAGATIDDIEDDPDDPSEDPVASAKVNMRDDGRYFYEVGPLLEGSYLAAFSCDEDDALEDEDLTYVPSADNPVNVIANQQATADFS